MVYCDRFGVLASCITKWSLANDKQLFRLACYVNTSRDYKLTLQVGDRSSSWRLDLWTDSDMGSCPYTKQSTAGIFAAITAPRTLCPLSGHSHKHEQSATISSPTADSTPEAEAVALEKGVTKTGVPLQELLEKCLGRSIAFTVHEDNDPTRKVIENGYSITLRHLSRLQGISLTP